MTIRSEGSSSNAHTAAKVYPEMLRVGDLLDGLPISDVMTQFSDPLPYSDFVWVRTADGRWWQMRKDVPVEGVEREKRAALRRMLRNVRDRSFFAHRRLS